MDRFPSSNLLAWVASPIKIGGSPVRRLAVSGGMERPHTFSATAMTFLIEYPRELAKFSAQVFPLSMR
jgi:hypothetical protein